jgi:ABC-type multidrug transport system fused ATPase/permease subunit
MSPGRSLSGVSGTPGAASSAADPTMPQTKSARSFSEAFLAGWRLLTPAERIRGAWLTAVQVLEGGLDVVAVGATLPLVAIVVQPDLVETNRQLRRLHELLGSPSHPRLLAGLAMAALALLTLRSVVSGLLQFGVQRYAARCQTRLARELLDECVHAPYPWFLTRNSSLLARLLYDDVSQWSRGFVQRLMDIADNAITVLLGAVLVLALAPAMGLAVVVGLGGLSFGLMSLVRPRLAHLSRVKRGALERTIVTASQALAGIKDVKLSSREDHFVGVFSDSYRLASETHARLNLWQQLVPLVLPVIGLASLMALVAIQWRSGTARGEIAAEMALLVLISSRIVPALTQLSSSVSLLWNVYPFVQGLHDLRASLVQAAAAQPSSAVTIGEVWDGRWAELTLARVSFTYPGAAGHVLRDVNAVIRGRGAYGVAGPSGAGKSTLVDLLLRLLDPTDGTITLDGRAMETLDRRAWQSRIGYVPQTPYISDDTLRANVAFGVPAKEIDDEWVRACLRQAQLEALVAELDHGLDTSLGDRGVRVSGGQRQRIAIARALYGRPTLLVLDEATSALDRIGETAVQDALNALHGQVTTVTIAHRLATIRHCDTIFLLDDGRLVAQGGYDELFAQNLLFRRMASDRTEEAEVVRAG